MTVYTNRCNHKDEHFAETIKVFGEEFDVHFTKGCWDDKWYRPKTYNQCLDSHTSKCYSYCVRYGSEGYQYASGDVYHLIGYDETEWSKDVSKDEVFFAEKSRLILRSFFKWAKREKLQLNPDWMFR